jgi:hypothetical protein
MTAKVKVGGAWHSVTAAKVKVGGTWRNVSVAFVKVGGTWRQWIAAVITDAFNRANGALGNTDTGQAWSGLRGTWSVVSNQANSADSASGYPLAAVALGAQDATTSASVSQGCGPAAWITDANNWWASFHYSSTSSGCGGGATGWSTSDPGSCACGSRETRSVGDCSGPASAWTTTVTTSCACGSVQTQAGSPDCSQNYLVLFGAGAAAQCATDGGTYSNPYCCFPTTQYRCSATAGSTTEYRCTDSTTSSTAHKLRLVSMVSGAIATTDDVSIASAPAAIKVVTAGTTITATAYSDAAMTTLLGTNAKTPASPNRGTSTGIVKAPGGLAQGSTVDAFSSAM